MKVIQIVLISRDFLDKLFVRKTNFIRGSVAMDYTFCVYSPTGEVHILNTLGRALCGHSTINRLNCYEIGIYVDVYKVVSFENLALEEALNVAKSLQTLGIGICGQCVASLYSNE